MSNDSPAVLVILNDQFLYHLAKTCYTVAKNQWRGSEAGLHMLYLDYFMRIFSGPGKVLSELRKRYSNIRSEDTTDAAVALELYEYFEQREKEEKECEADGL
jgi:hypothetical protein